MATTMKKCDCGNYKKHGGWTKADETQVKLIAQAVNSKQAEIVKVVCDECRKAGCNG